jgi:hypothetical protein
MFKGRGMNKALLFVPIILILTFIPAGGEEMSSHVLHRAISEPVLDFNGRVQSQNQYSLNFDNHKWGPSYTDQVKKGISLKGNPNAENDSFIPYITRQNLHQPLVGQLSMDFSRRSKYQYSKSSASEFLPTSAGDVILSGAAFLTNLAVHEFGHAVVADYVGVSSNRMEFFNKEGDQFFLGTSYVEGIEEESALSYTMGGEFFADLTFEHALQSYRNRPNGYNKALLFYSGTDFLLYSFYAFYLTDGHESFDPNNVSRETGLSEDMLFSIILAKTALNAYRIFSGNDTVIPYFTVNKNYAALNIAIPF